MKVASFNVNSIRARLDTVLDWLVKESPDILCLQETKVPDESFPAEAIQDLNYHVAFRGEKSYNGVAILGKSALKNVSAGFDENESGKTRLITARVGRVTVVNTYVPQGFHPLSSRFRDKLDWLQRLYDYFRRNYSPDRPLLWVGDFNIAPEPIDVYDPEHLHGQVGYHPDEHAALQKFRQWGFVDIFRKHQSGAQQYTFWDYRIRNAVAKRMGWRVDHVWATPPLARTSVSSWIDVGPRLGEKPSDHTLIVAEFRI